MPKRRQDSSLTPRHLPALLSRLRAPMYPTASTTRQLTTREMAGHSQFKNIMHRKGAQDVRRGRLFARLIREITVAAGQGLPDPAANPRLRSAVTAAREANMPKDTVDRAI